MRTGTQGFASARLRQARRARGLSGVDLADIVGVKSQTISAYEHGKATPSPQVVQALASALNVPIFFFVHPPLPESNATIFWRANSTATKTAQERAEVRLEWLHEITAYLRNFFEFPQVDVPDIDIPDDFRGITSDDIERAAVQVRTAWSLGDGPISDIIADLETHGIMTASMMMNAEKLDAFSQLSDIDFAPYVILSEDKASGARRNFDAAHELGHLVLHRNVKKKRINTPSDWRRLEDQAHHFARAFLLPAESFESELWMPSLDAFVAMKSKWNVSVQAMVFRCSDLETIDKTQESNMWINLSRRGWRKKEPLDEKLPKSRPGLICKSFEMIVDAKVRRADQIVSELALPPAEVEELACLPPGYLSGRCATVVPLPKFKDTDRPLQSSLFSEDRVISIDQFKRH